MTIQTRKVQSNVIDVTAQAVDGQQPGHASRQNTYRRTMQQENDQEFAQTYTGPTSLGGVGRPPGDGFNNHTDSSDCYADTVIMFHHSPRGVRFAIQGSTRNALIILFVVVMLISRPGVVEMLLNIVKSIVNIH